MWVEGTNANLVAWVVEDEVRLGELNGHLRSAEEEAAWARSELGFERNRRLEIVCHNLRADGGKGGRGPCPCPCPGSSGEREGMGLRCYSRGVSGIQGLLGREG